MINTQNFKTKTIFQPRKNPSLEKFWPIAFDGGYSSIKIYSPNMIACFPSFAKKMAKGQTILGKVDKKSILYQGEDGETWLVGEAAQNMISDDVSDNATSSMFIKDRFYSPMFLVITRVGLALGMMQNQYGSPIGKTLTIQTGLPSEYLKTNSEDLTNALAGEHTFKIKIGEENWQSFSFTVQKENISIMPQPMGSLISASTDANGGTVPQAKKLFSSNVLVFDPGFGTLDTFSIKNHLTENHYTFDNLGMRRVLEETADSIYEKYHVELSVPAMQKNLSTGTFRHIDKANRKSTLVAFSEILNEANKKICAEALRSIDDLYNGMFSHDYMIVTGGTGAAWSDMIKDYYKDIETLKILYAWENDTINPIFSNVRGYYMKHLNELKKMQ